MESKHTPGPWITEITKTTVWVGTPKNNGTKCDDVIFGIDIEDLKEEYKERNIANAQLAACAPEMLEALEKCLDIFKKIADAGRYPEFLLAENGGEGFMFLTSTIRKAKGGKQ